MKFLPGITLFWGVFTRRCGVRRWCEVRLKILTRISLFLDMDPQGDRVNICVCPIYGEGGVRLKNLTSIPLFLGVFTGGERTGEGVGIG